MAAGLLRVSAGRDATNAVCKRSRPKPTANWMLRQRTAAQSAQRARTAAKMQLQASNASVDATLALGSWYVLCGYQTVALRVATQKYA